MKFLFGSILYCVLLNIALCNHKRNNGDHDWFWNKNYTDKTSHDNDPDREFWRDSEETKTETPSDDPNNNRPEHEETTTERETMPPYWTPETTTELTSTENAYYKKRKLQALSCTENEHINIDDEFGCQLCTCNGEGVMLCTKIMCDQTGAEEESAIKGNHTRLLNDAVNTNLILREYATDCKPKTTVEAGQCTCSCVISGVLSCPKFCFYSDNTITESNGPTEASPTTSTEPYIDPYDSYIDDTVK